MGGDPRPAPPSPKAIHWPRSSTLPLAAQGGRDAQAVAAIHVAGIAQALGLTRNTVKTHVENALTMLGARNRIEVLNRLNELVSSEVSRHVRPR
jgi:hypothetical protein